MEAAGRIMNLNSKFPRELERLWSKHAEPTAQA
jgi:hypothetical protein